MPESLKARAANFAGYQQELIRETYKEASIRIEFIDQLISALGWDVDNTAGRLERFKDVVEPAKGVDGYKRARTGTDSTTTQSVVVHRAPRSA